MQCMEKDCTKEATHYPKVTVAPYSWPIERGMTMSLSLTFCLEHLNQLKAVDLFDEEGKRKLREITRIIHRSDVPLDFNRVKIEPRRIGDKEWQMLTSQKKDK